MEAGCAAIRNLLVDPVKVDCLRKAVEIHSAKFWNHWYCCVRLLGDCGLRVPRHDRATSAPWFAVPPPETSWQATVGII